MTIWTDPVTRASGDKITDSIWNLQLIDNLSFLYDINYLGFANIQDQKALGTGGGTFTQGAFRTRDLTTEVYDGLNRVSLSANQITFLAGQYVVLWRAPGWAVNFHQSRLYDITNTAVLGIGSVTYSNAGAMNDSIGFAYCSFSGSTVVELQHYCTNTFINFGFGLAGSITTEIYSEVAILVRA